MSARVRIVAVVVLAHGFGGGAGPLRLPPAVTAPRQQQPGSEDDGEERGGSHGCVPG